MRHMPYYSSEIRLNIMEDTIICGVGGHNKFDGFQYLFVCELVAFIFLV